MSIKKFYKIIQPEHESVNQNDNTGMGGGLYGNYTWYHRLVQGSAARLVKYREYDIMDNDIDVSRSLDIIAEEMTGNNPKDKQPLKIKLIDEPEQQISSATVVTLKSALRTWCKIQDWDKRLFELCRNTVKYGDCFFIRPKEKNKRYRYVHPKHVVSAAVSQDDVTDVRGWFIKTDYLRVQNSGTNYNTGGFSSSGDSMDHNVEQFDVNEVVRYTLNNEMSHEAPFGTSILRPVYTTFKQKELLEDAVLIYRIQRAPERRVFYVDVGRMPAHKVAGHLNQIKNEIKQKKIPSAFGGKAQVESVYNPQSMCLSLDTTIPLLDGRVLTLDEMITEHGEGKENWVYSVNPEDGEVVPGIVSWAGITRKNTETIKLTFDNGETLTCTPDHKIPVQGKGFIEAKDLTENDSLFPFNAREKVIFKNDKNQSTYTQIYNPKTKGWNFVHHMVAKFMKGKAQHNTLVFNEVHEQEEKRTIHHLNYDAKNNNPHNLAFMNGADHSKLHLSLSKNQEIKFNDEMFNRFNVLFENNPDMKLKNFMVLLNSDKIFMGIYRNLNKPSGDKTKKYKIKTDKIRQKMFLKFMKCFGFNNWREYRNHKFQKNINVSPTIKKSYNVNDIKLIQYIFNIIKNVSIHNHAIVNHLKDESEKWDNFVSLYENSGLKEDRTLAGNYQTINVPESGLLERISKYFGYKSFKNLVDESANFNHRVVKSERGPMQDTGTLTIDGDEKYHNYHTFAIGNSSTGIYVRNSEDFFFAQRSDGSGSRVETLPGGQGLGELSDLEYFYKKMWRAMRIPSSYMSNTMDDGAIDNAGRVGIAYMQEIKFTLYIERLQTFIENTMDVEFKKFLHDMNISVDPTIYEVVLPQPSDYSVSRDDEQYSKLLGTFLQADGSDIISKRFALRKYLHLSPDEIKENERLLAQEKGLDGNDDVGNLVKIYNPDDAELGGFEGGGDTGDFGDDGDIGDDESADGEGDTDAGNEPNN